MKIYLKDGDTVDVTSAEFKVTDNGQGFGIGSVTEVSEVSFYDKETKKVYDVHYADDGKMYYYEGEGY